MTTLTTNKDTWLKYQRQCPRFLLFLSFKHNDKFREGGTKQCTILSEIKHTCRPTEHMTTKYTVDKMVRSAVVAVMGFVRPHGKQYETRKLIIHKVWQYYWMEGTFQ